MNIDIDSSIQGLKAVWRPGAWDVIGVFGFLNRQQVFQDNPNIGIPGERRHMLAALRLERFGLGPANVGAHANLVNYTDQIGWEQGFVNMTSTPDVIAAGGTLELVGLGPTDWYVEADGFAYPTRRSRGGGARPRPATRSMRRVRSTGAPPPGWWSSSATRTASGTTTCSRPSC
ncbi:MAG: hypothetical protein KC656_37810, partial [Myxococcales bacterium]|nr:hypothetical protein [Myxococcales bacterium]